MARIDIDIDGDERAIRGLDRLIREVGDLPDALEGVGQELERDIRAAVPMLTGQWRQFIHTEPLADGVSVVWSDQRVERGFVEYGGVIRQPAQNRVLTRPRVPSGRYIGPIAVGTELRAAEDLDDTLQAEIDRSGLD